jgi:molecular chaperone HscC
MIAGIDLGTTHSLAAIWRNGRSELVQNALGDVLTPSVVSIDDDGTILVGQAARERLQTHPGHTASVFKRAMGTAKTFRLGKREFRAEELSSLVLRALKSDLEAALGEPVTEAVVTVPAYFSDAQRQATLLNEPTAAALAYGMHQKQSETQFLVFDLGGGTFDVSVLEMFDGVMEVRATAGDNHLGGEDIDQLLMAHFVRETGLPDPELNRAATRAQLGARIEAAKKTLSLAENAPISINAGGRDYAMTLTADVLEACIKPLMDRLREPVERAMRDARLRPAELDAVVLAGGSTRLASIRQWATRMFGRFPETALNPDEVVALGAAVQAGLKMNDAALSERVMTDVCPYTLGIETSRQISSGRHASGFMAPVLDRNTVIPASRVQQFSPIVDFQKELRLAVYQGEGRRVSENIKLGEFSVNLPSGRTHEVSVDVRFTYDVNGLLEVEATVNKNGQAVADPVRLVIENSADHLSSEQIAERLAALHELKIHPRDQIETRTLMARAERFHSQLLGHAREHLADVITRFEVVLESQDQRRIAPVRQELSDLLKTLDADRYVLDDA